MSVTSRGRAAIASCALACVFTGFSFRLVHIQVTKHEEYAALAADNHAVKQTIYARRGSILDAHGLPLAQNEPVKTVVADGSLIKDPEVMAALLAKPLAMSEKVLLEKLTRKYFSKREGVELPSRYIVLKKEVPELVATAIGDQLAEAKLRGIFFEQESIRVYPNADMLCHVLGYIDHDNRGIEGIERVMDDYLHGHDGFRYTERDRTGKEIVPYRGQERPPRDGCNVSLTIDMGLQTIVESELDAACKQYRPKMAICILMRPQTGEILALANRPHYNLNQQEGVPPEHRKNRAIMDMVEPGSTFKIVTTAAALAQKLVGPSTMIFCENGSYTFGGKTLHDHHPYAELSVGDILVKSSNIGVAKIGLQLGDQRLYEYIRKFGFGERTGINLPGEIGGIVHPPHRWSKISIVQMPMGQGVGVTPLQVVTATSVIANGGKLMMPQIVREVTDEHGEALTSFPPVEVRRVVPETVASQVRDALIEVTSKRGTAQLARVAGFKVAGKTGTAQKVSPNGGYEHGKYVVSFAGFMPADKPEFAALVMFDEANTKPGENYGGLVAAPVFSRIAERAARYLNLQPSPEEPESSLIATKAEHMRD
ncbi:peptidoglycan D,D-transpeptidase FtsI family protein [Verrucomicrobiota bacterium sgz303538]